MRFQTSLMALVAASNGAQAYIARNMDNGSGALLGPRCVTHFARNPATAEIETRWSLDSSCTETSTCTETCTETPADVTTTVTVSTVTCTMTDSTATSMATITSSSTTTGTTTSISTRTITATATSTSTSTSTESAPATFTPIRRTFQGSVYDGTGGPNPVSDGAAAADAKRSVEKQQHFARDDSDMASGGGIYVRGVTCEDCVDTTTTVTTTTMTTTLCPSTCTVSTTATITTTTTPSASSSITVTRTVSVTSTATATASVTSTRTQTVTTSTTVYAACATDNFGSQGPDAFAFGSVDLPADNGFLTTSAYDCCVIAITRGTINNGRISQAWSFFPASGLCLSWSNGESCPNPPNMNVKITRAGDPTSRTISGNSYCGQISGFTGSQAS